ncbi:MAG: DUF4834 family protein [Flavobacteriaceae bacterium]|nr:DUF4834 family protein [Psychroflexus sp.]
MDFLENLLIILLVFFALRIILKWAAPYIFKFFMKKVQSKFENQFNPNQQSRRNHKDDQDIINERQSSRKTNDKKVGEYIDYEEIE